MPDASTRTRFRIDDPDGGEAFAACQRLAEALLPPPRLRALLERAQDSPLAALRGIPVSELRGPALGLTEKQVARLTEAAAASLPPRFAERALASRVTVLTFQDPAYPTALLPLSDSPPMLFVRGELLPDDRFAFAIVGSRRATAYGREQAERFARAFAESGLAVVSGGAAGIDTAAHHGALTAGGRTISVLGCGVDIAYPAENRALFDRIASGGGAVISEFGLGTRPEPWRFPTRNRIIAGMARATVLIETPENSGALGTARNAADYGRDVWAVPGPVDTGRSRGGHQLLQDGALLADRPEDILNALGLTVGKAAELRPTPPRPDPSEPLQTPPATPDAAPATRESAPLPPLSDEEARLLPHFDLSARLLDEAAGLAGLSASQATVAATLLEMKGLVRRQPGNLFVRAL